MTSNINGYIDKVGESILLDSGCLIVAENEVVVYTINIPNDPNKKPLVFKFRFTGDDSKKDENGNLQQFYTQTVQQDGSNNEYLDFAFVNMRDGNFVGNISKITLGYISGYVINFRFRIQSIQSTYVIFYTFLLDTNKGGENITQAK